MIFFLYVYPFNASNIVQFCLKKHRKHLITIAKRALPVMMLSTNVVGMQKMPTNRSLMARLRMKRLVTVRMFLLLSTIKHTTPFPTMHTIKMRR